MTALQSTRIRIPNVLPDGTRQVHLVFNVTRGKPLVGRTVDLIFESTDKRNVLTAGPGGFHVASSRRFVDGEPFPVAADELVEVELLSQEERPEPVRLVFEGADGAVGLYSRGAPCLDPDLLWVDTSTALAAQTPGPIEYHNALETLLNDPATPNSSFRRFYFDLDRHTAEHLRSHYLSANPSSPFKLGDVTRHINELMDFLPRRLRARHQAWTNGAAPPLPNASETQVEALQYLSNLFAHLANKHFPASQPTLDPEECVRLFGHGELRIEILAGLWTTQPSSGYLLLFGELALTCIEHGIVPYGRPAFWEQTARAFVLSQELFERVYSPCVANNKAVMLDYCSCTYDATKGIECDSLQALIDDYDALTFDQLRDRAAQNTHAIVPGEI